MVSSCYGDFLSLHSRRSEQAQKFLGSARCVNYVVRQTSKIVFGYFLAILLLSKC